MDAFRIDVFLAILSVYCHAVPFLFGDFRVVNGISCDVADSLACGCLVVINPIRVSPSQQNFLAMLTTSLAKGALYYPLTSARAKDRDVGVASLRNDKIESGTSLEIDDGHRHRHPKVVMSYDYERFKYYYAKNYVNSGSCFKTLNILMVTESTQQQLAELSQFRVFRQSIWLLFMNQSINPAVDVSIKLWYDSSIWLIQPADDLTYTITELYRAAKWVPPQSNLLGSWSSKNGLNLVKTPKPLRRRDLQGIKLRTGVLENWPVVYYNDELQLDGFFPAIWAQLEQLLHFSSHLMLRKDGQAGILESDGSWSGVVGMLHRNEVDVILADLDFSASRLEALEYLLPLKSGHFQVYFPLKGFVLEWFAILKPFALPVWGVLVAWWLLASIVLVMNHRIATRNGLQDSVFDYSFMSVLYFVLQTISFQGSQPVPRIWCSRVLFLVCYLLAAVLLPAYSASLISSLTMKKPAKPFDSLSEMLTTDYWMAVSKDSARREYFDNTDDNVLTAVRERLWFVPDEHEAINATNLAGAVSLVCQRARLAIFDVDTEMYSLFRTVNKPPCPLLRLSRPLSLVHQSMAFGKHSPYRETVNYFILRMLETGTVKRYREKYMPSWPRGADRAEIPVTLVDVAFIFLFLFLSILASLVILLLEITTSLRSHI